MLKPEVSVTFGEWLPDVPYYQNPGLVEAKNVIPVDNHYKDFLEFEETDDTLNARPQGAFAAIDSNGDPEIYVGTEKDLYEKVGSAYTARSAATYGTATNGYWRFAQFDELVIGANYADNLQTRTVGSASAFTALATAGTAPKARQIGVINRFVIVGDTSDTANGAVPSRIEWAAINDPRNWPDPGSASARTLQSGEQFLNSGYGSVTGISNGQFYGLVLQQRAVNRLTYVGGDVVWQVQEIDNTRGCWVPQSLIQIGGISYFISADGFFATNGQVLTPIGDGKVDKWFYGSFDQAYRERVTAAFDYVNKCIFWSYPSSGAISGLPDRVIIYNIMRNKWAWGEEALQLLLQSYTQGYTLDQLDSLYTSIDDIPVTLDSSTWSGGIPTIQGFLNNRIASFGGSALPARFETGEFDGNPFGRIFVRGARPLITGNPTSVTVSIGLRDSQDNADRSFTDATARNSRTGVCDFRHQGKFVSTRMDISGGFDRAIGLQVDAEAGDGI